MYMGDHWAVVKSLAAVNPSLHCTVWICSAGYGLIGPGTVIKSYRATFRRGEPDYVAGGFEAEERGPQRWWNGLVTALPSRHSLPRSLRELATAAPKTPIIAALSNDYFYSVQEDLAEVRSCPFFRTHLSVISCGTDESDPGWRDHLLPCDATLAAAVGGALTSLNVRVLRAVLAPLGEEPLTTENLRSIAAGLDRSSRAVRPGENMSTSAVMAYIGTALRTDPTASKSRLLRRLRDEGKACEQKRFGRIFDSVKETSGGG